jgi:hypothetical protein
MIVKTHLVRQFIKIVVVVLLLLSAGCQGKLPETNVKIKQLKSDFLNLTEDTRPWVYYYWIKGHMSKEGITNDLEAMSRVGIGQVLVGSDIDQGKGEYGPVMPLSDEWWELIDHTILETGRLT